MRVGCQLFLCAHCKRDGEANRARQFLGIAVTSTSGTTFTTGSSWDGLTVAINGQDRIIAWVANTTSSSFTITNAISRATATLPVHYGVFYQAGQVSKAVPVCANSETAIALEGYLSGD